MKHFFPDTGFFHFRFILRYICTCLLISSPAVSLAQEEQAPIELVVTGSESLQELKDKVFEAERNVYEVFNSLNDDNDYDITCHREYRTGTLLATINCRPNFVDDLRLEYGRENPTDRGVDDTPDTVLREYQKRLQEKMTSLITENSEFRTAVGIHNALSLRLQEMEAEEVE